MGDEVKAAAERLLELGTHSGVRPIYLYEPIQGRVDRLGVQGGEWHS
jgi:hypothetical protein